MGKLLLAAPVLILFYQGALDSYLNQQNINIIAKIIENVNTHLLFPVLAPLVQSN